MGDTPMVESAERAGVDGRGSAGGKSTAMCKSAMRNVVVRESTAGMDEPRMSVTEVRVMAEGRTVRDVPVMIVQHIVVVPVGSPVMPAPAETSEDADPNTQAERNPWAIEIEAGNADPRGVVWERISVDDPWIVFGYVNDVRICRFNRNRLSVIRDSFLLRTLQVPSLLRPLAHHL